MNDSISVLVVDDNEDLLETFAMILKRRGFQVDTAIDGRDAAAKYESGNFDVTLMDIVMPNMNGVDAFRKIKEINPGAVVILMTAYSEEDLIKVALEEGAHKVVNKPLKVDQIIELINMASREEPILIVDDDEDLLHTLARMLASQGHRVLMAGSGEEAIKVASEQDCSIAFVDVKLPLMDGLQTYLNLKAINPALSAVMMTGYRNEVRDALDKARKAAAIGCLFKPFDPHEALELIAEIRGKSKKSVGKG